VVAKYSNVWKVDAASIFMITELISVATMVIRREKFVAGVERFVVHVVSLVTCIWKKGNRRPSPSSARICPKELSFVLGHTGFAACPSYKYIA